MKYLVSTQICNRFPLFRTQYLYQTFFLLFPKRLNYGIPWTTSIYTNKNVNVRLFKILNLRKFFTDCFEILTQRCIRIRACFYILYRVGGTF
jgi:hypothetical protein